MTAKVAAAEETKDQKQEGGADEGKKGPKPMTKWQKIGYITFGVVMTGSLVANAILFGKKYDRFDLRYYPPTPAPRI